MVCGTFFLLGRVKGQPVPCRFCGSPDSDGHLFWECTFPPLVEIRENPEFHDLMRMDKAHWPRCLLWHGWLPMLSGVDGASLWAADASESAFYLVETALGRYSSGLVSEWSHPYDFGADEVSAISRAVVNHDEFGGTAPDPMVWSAGSLPKRRRIVHAVRNLAMLPGPPALWLGEWVAGPSVTFGAEDVAQWPYTTGLLVKWVSFLGSLHWLVERVDLGVGGVSCVELLIL